MCYLGINNFSNIVFANCNLLYKVSVTEKYPYDKFCGKPVSNKDETCISESNSAQSSEAPDDRKYVVVLELDEGINNIEKDQIYVDLGINPDKVSVKLEKDDNDNIICVLVYVNDEKTANIVAVQVNEKIQQCENV